MSVIVDSFALAFARMVVSFVGLVALLAPCRVDAGARGRYIDIMDRAFEAYGEQGSRAYLDKVRKSGLTEHGFPRLSADLAILVAHGKRTELKPLMEDMMGFCCEAMNATNRPKGTGNDFSVRELVCAILELEKANAASPGKTAAWRAELSRIYPTKCYDCIAPDASVPVHNWAMFNAGSEMARVCAGVTTWEKAGAYVERQIGSQMLAFIPEGLYRDPHWAMQYDLVGRMTLAFALHFGYNGRYRARAENLLMRAAPIALKMQSVTGEMPFGGRSNQFLHNEAWMALQFEYYASEYAKRGDMKSAGQCKDAAALATDAMFRWLDAVPSRHVKNRWPKGSSNGCEGYGYFDKYMITMASFAYAAYMMADDSIAPVPCPARDGGYVMKAPDPFHKVFANAGGYFLEFDTAADLGYDASGLGRVQRAGAPEIICLSVPFPGPNAHYGVTPPNSRPVAIGVPAGAASRYMVDRAEMDGAAAVVELKGEAGFIERYRVDGDGIGIEIKGAEVCRAPVLETDGTEMSRIDAREKSVTMFWHGWKCVWTTDGTFEDTGERYSNRNGVYRLFVARGKGRSVGVRIRILPDAGVTAK